MLLRVRSRALEWSSRRAVIRKPLEQNASVNQCLDQCRESWETPKQHTHHDSAWSQDKKGSDITEKDAGGWGSLGWRWEITVLQSKKMVIMAWKDPVPLTWWPRDLTRILGWLQPLINSCSLWLNRCLCSLAFKQMWHCVSQSTPVLEHSFPVITLRTDLLLIQSFSG